MQKKKTVKAHQNYPLPLPPCCFYIFSAASVSLSLFFFMLRFKTLLCHTNRAFFFFSFSSTRSMTFPRIRASLENGVPQLSNVPRVFCCFLFPLPADKGSNQRHCGVAEFLDYTFVCLCFFVAFFLFCSNLFNCTTGSTDTYIRLYR